MALFHATPANRSDTEEFVTVLDEVDVRAGESVYADKGYSSLLNRYVLAVRGLSDGIMSLRMSLSGGSVVHPI